MTTKQKPPHDLIKAAQEMAAHFRGKLTLTKRKVMPSGDDDAVQVSTVKRWLNKPGFQTAFEKEYKEFLVSEEAARNGIHNTDKASEVPHKAVRQHAIAALNLTQQAKKILNADDDLMQGGNTALIDGVRKFTMDVRDLEIDLIDRINPFGEAYAILAKAMTEESLKQVQAVIAGKKTTLTLEEARGLAKRALQFKQERGRLPSLTSPDPWEKKMAEGIAFLARMKAEAANG